MYGVGSLVLTSIEKTEPTKSNLNLELDKDENLMLDGEDEEELSEE